MRMPRRLFVLLSNAATSPDTTAAIDPSKSDSHSVQVDAGADIYTSTVPHRARRSRANECATMWPHLP